MRLKLFRRGNLKFLADFAPPLYESDFVRVLKDAKIKNKTVLLRSADEKDLGKYHILYVCDYFVRLWSYSSDSDIVAIHDYCYKDRLERLVCLIPINHSISFIEIGRAREYENPESIVYVFTRDGYCYFFASFDEVLEMIEFEPGLLETMIKNQREWDEMVRKA